MVSAMALFVPSVLAAQAWEPVGPGFPSAVYALEGFQGHLYAAGTFTQVGGTDMNYLARWDGSAWGATGNLTTYMAADGLYANDTALFVGDGGKVRLWNGTQWAWLTGSSSSSFNSSVYSMAHFRDTLYVGGFFSSPFAHVAKWNGSAYEGLSSGCSDQVSALMPVGDRLFAGGNFSTAGGVAVHHTALWNGSAWEPMGGGVNDDVFTHCIFNDTLYIGGRFTQANGQAASRVAKWNGGQWVPVGGALDDYVSTMAVYRGRLYIGGSFTTPSRIARLQGNSWVAVGGGMNGNVRTLEVFNDTLFAGGSFTTAGGAPMDRIAKWYMPAPPVAAFSMGDTLLCTGHCTLFTDLSANGPASRQWSFPGGEPATSGQPSPTVCYAEPGVYDVVLTVQSPGGSDTLIRDGAVTVEVCTAVPQGDAPRPITAFPNPFHDRLHLSLSGNAGQQVSVYDGRGIRMGAAQDPARDMALDTRTWPPGIYIVEVVSPAGVQHVQAVKE